MFDNHFIIEAIGAGLSGADLRVQRHMCGYRVFRPRNPRIAQGAAACSKMMFDIQHQQRTLKYDLPGAVKSLVGGSGHARSAEQMDKLLDDILAGKGHPFFCSQFAVYVYQFVAEQSGMRGVSMFAASDAKVSPAALAALLSHSPNFSEAGDLPSGHS